MSSSLKSLFRTPRPWSANIWAIIASHDLHALLDDGNAYEAYSIYVIPRFLLVDGDQIVRFESTGRNVLADDIRSLVEEFNLSGRQEPSLREAEKVNARLCRDFRGKNATVWCCNNTLTAVGTSGKIALFREKLKSAWKRELLWLSCGDSVTWHHC